MKIVTLRLTDDLHRAFVIYAKQARRSMQTQIVCLMEEALQHEAHSRVHPPSVHAGEDADAS